MRQGRSGNILGQLGWWVGHLGGDSAQLTPVASYDSAALATIGSGGSVGREGPIVQIGAAAASRLGRVLRVPTERRRILIGCGVASGMAAAYNRWAAQHETVMAKSLLCAGTTWPGVWLAEDRRALDILCAREDVDGQRVGCGGLSGGGMRTVFLAGSDPRIRCAVR